MAEQKARRVLSKLKWVAGAAIGLFILFLILSIWFGATGGGEYKDSPSGKYTAHLTLYTQRTVTRGKIQYVQIKVEEKGQGEVVWEMTYHPPPGSSLHIYGDRSREFIRWEMDSSAVHFPLDTNGTEIIVPMP